MSLTKVTYSMIDGPVLNLKDYGAVGDGVANDTAAWLAFKAACAAQSAIGEIPAGTYLIDAFSMGSADTGLTFRGVVQNSKAPPPVAAGYFGPQATVLKLRQASAAFVTISGCYYFKFENIAFDGGDFADSVILFPGDFTVTSFEFNRCDFYGATPNTGILHHYATGSQIQVDRGVFRFCSLQQARNAWNGTPHLHNILNTNTNAFIVDYHQCFFQQATELVRFGAGSCNFYNCQFFAWVTRCFRVDSITQPFVLEYPYTEAVATTPFFTQAGTAGVQSDRPIVIIGMDIAADTPIELNCQQPVLIYGGFTGGNIQINPLATFGVFRNIIDGVGFATGKSITGSGAITFADRRNISYNKVMQADTSYGSLNLLSFNESSDEGATINVTQKPWVNVDNSVAQNVTGLTGGVVGQIVVLLFRDANTTLVHGTNFKLTGSANVTPTASSVITFIGTGAAPGLTPISWVEISRSIK